AHEVGVAGRIVTERVVVSANKPSAEVMASNPLNKIPTLILQDGTTLYDSRVICEYFDSLHHGPKLFPSAEPRRWQALKRQSLGDGLLDVLILRLVEQNRPRELQSESHLAAYHLKTAAALDSLEAEEPEPTAQPDIGHIAIGCALSYIDFRFAANQWRSS